MFSRLSYLVADASEAAGNAVNGGGADFENNLESFYAYLQEKLIDLGLNILAAIAIYIIGMWIAKIVTKMATSAMNRSKLDKTIVNFIGHLVRVLLTIIVIIAALKQVGIETNSFIAVIGAAGLAIGFALQGSLANFASGIMLIIFRPFQVGHFISAAGIDGVVEDIGMFTTSLKTPDNKLVIVPNAAITGGSITNFSANENRRIDLIFGVSYSSNLDAVRKVVQEVMAAEERILETPEPFIGVHSLGDSSINFAVRPWVKTENYWAVFFALNENIKKAFDKAGIEIPFPQRDVHVFNEK